MNWLDKLREAKALIEGLKDSGADLMRRVAAAMEKIADAVKDSADIIDAPAVTADGEALRTFKAEIDAVLAAPGVMAFPWEQLLFQLISKLVEEILKRRFPTA